jgi:hypothetical protein
VTFRGLDPGVEYTVFDYVNGKELGTLSGGDPVMELAFERNLLVRLTPETN